MSGPPPTVPSVLLPEILGFVPQYLLDDIINIANEAAQQTVDAMEGFLLHWAETRQQQSLNAQDPSSSSSSVDLKVAQEIEQGLVALQTLLDSHVDIAFDFFEVWSLRNIFAIPAGLPVVAPHQQGLDLTHEEEEETRLLAEIDDMRRKLAAQRKLRRLYTRAVRQSAVDLTAARTRLSRLAFLRSPQLQTLLALPDSFLQMWESVSTLPPLDPPPLHVADQGVQGQLEQGKRPWEVSKSAYLNWAVGQMMARAKESERAEAVEAAKSNPGTTGGGEVGPVARTVDAAFAVAGAEEMKAALEELTGKSVDEADENGVAAMDTR